MKKNEEKIEKYQYLINQLLTLFFSGVYITNLDIIIIAKKAGYELPSKNREILIKNLFSMAQNDGKLSFVLDGFLELLNIRFNEYKVLTKAYPNINEISSLWAQKINTIKRLLATQRRGNIYE